MESCARTSNSVCIVLGGGSQIYVDSHDQSPVLKSFELFGYSASSIPNYPLQVFWHEHDLDGKRRGSVGLWWKRAYQKCYRWKTK